MGTAEEGLAVAALEAPALEVEDGGEDGEEEEEEGYGDAGFGTGGEAALGGEGDG